ncbi:MAG: xylulokinase [Kordiimonadaceae bacterium]|jgi:xylulokinase|nr:xylulokinase [Kordiimonadaceae bacterium]MBT6032488.1 xylulokinase [Kordiimonadaceae bacterium]
MGIDLGTQSIKVIIYNPDIRKTLTTASHSFDLISKEDGSREQQAEWWIEGFKKCLSKMAKEDIFSVAAIGVSGQQHGFVPIDKNGTVLAPVKLWCDTATEAECHEIMDAVGGEVACIQKAGNPIAVGYTASKIRWLKHNNPSSYTNMSTILLPHDYMNFYLTGNRTMECGDASGTGLLDVRNRKWSKELISALDSERDLTDCLPNLIEADDIAGSLKPDLAKELGFNNDVIVSAGGGDNMMAAIGTGNVEMGKLTASLGTSGTLFAFHDKPAIDPNGELAAFCSSTGGWLPLLCTMNCTVATEQMRDLLEVDLEHMEELACQISPGADGVITVPFFNGERTPALPKAKASIFGLGSHNTTKAHFIRSTMEAAIFNMKAGLNAFAKCGMTFNEVTLTGGGSKSTLWRQICADILNLPVRVLTQEENAAYGAALQALWALNKKNGVETSIGDITREHLQYDISKACSPDANSVLEYKNIYKEYQSFVKLITPHYK